MPENAEGDVGSSRVCENDAGLLIVGAGQYGRVAREIAESTGVFSKIDFLDDRCVDAVGTLADYKHLQSGYDNAVVAVGNSIFRLKWIELLSKAGYDIPVLVHPTACISTSACLMAGTIVEPLAVVCANATIQSGCIVSAGAVVSHDCSIGSGCHLDCNSVVASGSAVPAMTKIPCGEVYAGDSLTAMEFTHV